jgi:modification methylase
MAEPCFRLDDPSTEIYVGDCREVLAGLPAGSVDLIFADPPFN